VNPETPVYVPANIDINSYLSAVDLNLFLDITTLLFNIADSTPTERDVGNGSPSKSVKRTESIFCVSSRSPIGFTSVAAIGKWYCKYFIDITILIKQK